MASTRHECDRRIIVRVLEHDLVRYELVVEARLRKRPGGRHVLIEDVPQVLDGGGDDARATGGADDEVERPVGILDNGGRYRREGTFTGADVVRGGRYVAEGVGGTRDGEVCTECTINLVLKAKRKEKYVVIPFISLFMMTPVSGTMSCEPNRRFTVVVREMAMPDASAVTTCEVPGLLDI